MRISIGFKLKRSKKRNDETIPVYVNIILNRRRVELSTRIFVSPNNWDPAKERVSGTSNKAKTINNRLDKVATNILDILISLKLKTKNLMFWISKTNSMV